MVVNALFISQQMR